MRIKRQVDVTIEVDRVMKTYTVHFPKIGPIELEKGISVVLTPMPNDETISYDQTKH
jgi:hypothetical protein